MCHLPGPHVTCVLISLHFLAPAIAALLDELSEDATLTPSTRPPTTFLTAPPREASFPALEDAAAWHAFPPVCDMFAAAAKLAAATDLSGAPLMLPAHRYLEADRYRYR